MSPAMTWETSSSPAAAPLPSSAADRSAGPVDVPGTQVVVADTLPGSAVTFTTTPDRVTELRSKVHAMAYLRNERLARKGATGGMVGTGVAPNLTLIGASQGYVEDVDGGARMDVAPFDPMEVDRFRASVRFRAERLAQGGGCTGDWIP